tara:strand:+ start:184 stop:510 length:327 start_codon:yes stop_codon:yes gene_type:complete
MDVITPTLTGARVYFALPDALKGTLAEQLKCVRPTLFFGVPRVWEKVSERSEYALTKTLAMSREMATDGYTTKLTNIIPLNSFDSLHSFCSGFIKIAPRFARCRFTRR